MTRALLVLDTKAIREKAIHWIKNVPDGSRVEFKAPKRSLDQNAKMWACLTDVSAQVPWHGLKLSSDDWRLIFLDGLRRENRIVPNINGNGFVNLSRSSSDLSKDEFSDLIELISAFGAEKGVKFSDSAPDASSQDSGTDEGDGEVTAPEARQDNGSDPAGDDDATTLPEAETEKLTRYARDMLNHATADVDGGIRKDRMAKGQINWRVDIGKMSSEAADLARAIFNAAQTVAKGEQDVDAAARFIAGRLDCAEDDLMPGDTP